MVESNLVNKSRELAINAHEGQFRKVNRIPFFKHVEEVAELVASVTDDEVLISVGYLHDVVEDTNITLSQLSKIIQNDKVVHFVDLESEDKREYMSSEDSWKIRKEEQITHFRNLSESDKDVLIVALADKVSNLRSLADTKIEYGDKMWNFFNNKEPMEHKWYYSSFLDIIKDSKYGDSYLCREMEDLIKEIWG